MISRPSGANKTVLVIGSGGREHALAWKLSRSPMVSRVIVAPGNDAWTSEWVRWADVDTSKREEFAGIAERARRESVDLAVIGPDNPLADGLADILIARGILTFGPVASAARLESSKTFAKEIMLAAGVSTARYFRADSVREASGILETLSLNWGSGWVIKCDGLALGKGVCVCATPDEAFQALDNLSRFASTFVIEERVFGEELSWMAFCDGSRCALLDPARDHKRLQDGDKGPNTGGMGAFSPVPGFDSAFGTRIRTEVFLPVLAELKKRGISFQGVLYAGLMVDRASGNYSVLEFNARFGDPEAQVLMLRMRDDLYPWCEAVARGDISLMPDAVSFKPESAVVVVGAASGYPENPERGNLITVPKQGAFPPRYFWAGVKRAQGQNPAGAFVTAGGRVFGATGSGSSLDDARKEAYAAIKEVSFSGVHYRRDIGAPQGTPIAVFASGRGSNFEAIQRAIEAGELDARIVAVISDRADAPVLEKARKIGIPAHAVLPDHAIAAAGERRKQHEEAIIHALEPHGARFIVLAGYMRLIGPTLLERFRSDRGFYRVVNIHPSLLPAFPGKDSYRQAFEHGAMLAGVTVHLVDETLDGGPICAQEAFPIGDCRTLGEVEVRGLGVEHRLYPKALGWILTERFTIAAGKRVRIAVLESEEDSCSQELK